MFVISIAALKRNTAILREVKEAAGCHLVLALKGFSCWKAFPYLRDDLDGCCASGLWEALLARDYFQKHVITYSPAYDEADIAALCEFTHHLDFNSLSQWFRFREMVMAHPRFKSGELHCGLRVNPECSTGHTPIYDPCVAGIATRHHGGPTRRSGSHRALRPAFPHALRTELGRSRKDAGGGG